MQIRLVIQDLRQKMGLGGNALGEASCASDLILGVRDKREVENVIRWPNVGEKKREKSGMS